MLLYVDLGKLEDEPYRLSKIYDTLGQYIDDTLRAKETGLIPESVKDVFHQLKEKGIRTGIATDLKKETAIFTKI